MLRHWSKTRSIFGSTAICETRENRSAFMPGFVSVVVNSAYSLDLGLGKRGQQQNDRDNLKI